jgi:hypothetical protein
MRKGIGRGLSLGTAIALGIGMLGVQRAGAAETATISVGLNADGRGSMIANSQTNPDGEIWSWEVCMPDLSSCAAFASGRIVTTAGASVKRRFRVTSNLGATATSPVWRGKPDPLTPPSIRGPLRANELVTPISSRWRGGWNGDRNLTQLAACRSRRGRQCTTLTDTHYPDACPRGAAVLDPAFTGQYLRVANFRIGADTGILDYRVGSPYGHEIWAADPVTSVAIVGRIASATNPRRAECGAPPLLEASISESGRSGGPQLAPADHSSPDLRSSWIIALAGGQLRSRT